MANPAPPAATYPAMHVRAGYADAAVLTTAELDQVAAFLVAQDGNGNVQELQCVRIGAAGFLTVDNNGVIWLTFNAYWDVGTQAWYALNIAQDSYAMLVGGQVAANYAPAANGPLTWVNMFFQAKTTGTFTNLNTNIASALASIAANTAAISVLYTEYLGLITPGPKQWRTLGAGTWVLNSTDRYINANVAGGAVNITLPTSHQEIGVACGAGCSPSNPVTVTPDVPGGNMPLVMESSFQSNNFSFDTNTGIWRIM